MVDINNSIQINDGFTQTSADGACLHFDSKYGIMFCAYMPEQVLKTHEKICTDLFLRYCEQMRLKKEDRDMDCVNGTYMKMYHENFEIMIKRKGIPFLRKIMYLMFSFDPTIGVKSAILFNHRR